MIDTDVEKAASRCNNCDNCTPIGKRNKRDSIRDGRFDTKEKCCETRRRETGCPVATRVMMIKKIREQDTETRLKYRDSLRDIISHISDEDCCGEMNSDECLAYEANCTLCKFDHAVDMISKREEK